MTKLEYVNKFNLLYPGKLPLNFLTQCVESIKLNDPAHDLDHVYYVCKTGLEIFDKFKDVYKLTERERLLVFIACLLHDLGCRYNRADHHLIGYGLAYNYITNYFPDEFNCEEIQLIATCVLEHRSSSSCKPTSILSEIVSVADSGKPSIHTYATRAIIFRLSDEEKRYRSKDEIINEAYEHILDKFGSNGYHWKSYPNLGKKLYCAEWEEFKYGIENKPFLLALLEEINDAYIDKLSPQLIKKNE